MAKRAPKAPVAPAAPAPSTAPVKRPRNEALAPRDINRQGTTRVKLTGVLRVWYDNVRRSSAVIVEVIVGGPKGPHRDYFLGIGRPDFIGAKKQMGDDMGQWAGQILTVEQDSTGQYVNVHDDERPVAGGKPAPSWGDAPATDVADDDIPF